MQIALEQFDISVFNSQDISLNTPEGLMAKLILMINSLTDSTTPEEDKSFEPKIRALINALVIEGLKNSAWMRAESSEPIKFRLPKLSELDFKSYGDLSIVKFQHRLIILAPKISTHSDANVLLNILSNLIDNKEDITDWVLDLSLIEQFPFELLGYLIGLKHTLERKGVNLDLLWLREDAIPTSLHEAVNRNFQLLKKGSFLLSQPDPRDLEN